MLTPRLPFLMASKYVCSPSFKKRDLVPLLGMCVGHTHSLLDNVEKIVCGL